MHPVSPDNKKPPKGGFICLKLNFDLCYCAPNLGNKNPDLIKDQGWMWFVGLYEDSVIY